MAVLIPVLDRPHRVAPLLASLRESVEGSVSLEVSPCFVCSPKDKAQINAVEREGVDPLVMAKGPGPGDYAKKINHAARENSHAEWFFLAADDLVFTAGWLQAGLAEHFQSNACVVGTNDAANQRVKSGQHSTHTLVHRAYLDCGTVDRDGQILHEGYDHNFCNPAEAPIWMADCSFKSLGDVRVGDVVVGWERIEAEAERVGTPRRALCYSDVLAVKTRVAPMLVRVVLESGREFRCTPDHRWLNANWAPSTKADTQFVTPKVGRSLLHVVERPTPIPNDLARAGGWLAGIYDGEGSGIVVATQSIERNPGVAEAIAEALSQLGIDYRMTLRPTGIAEFVLNGGRQGYLNFLLRVDPVRRKSLAAHVLGWRSRNSSRLEREEIGARRFGMKDKIVAVEPLPEEEVISLTTSSGNYIAWGYASRNCDDELVATAKARGTYSWARASVVRHLHPTFKTAPMDATYEKALAKFADDRRLFLEREHLWQGTSA